MVVRLRTCLAVAFIRLWTADRMTERAPRYHAPRHAKAILPASSPIPSPPDCRGCSPASQGNDYPTASACETHLAATSTPRVWTSAKSALSKTLSIPRRRPAQPGSADSTKNANGPALAHTGRRARRRLRFAKDRAESSALPPAPAIDRDPWRTRCRTKSRACLPKAERPSQASVVQPHGPCHPCSPSGIAVHSGSNVTKKVAVPPRFPGTSHLRGLSPNVS